MTSLKNKTDNSKILFYSKLFRCRGYKRAPGKMSDEHVFPKEDAELVCVDKFRDGSSMIHCNYNGNNECYAVEALYSEEEDSSKLREMFGACPFYSRGRS